jgi:hypothetical protein
MDYSRLSMPLGEAVFTQRSIRRFRPDAIPLEDVRLILEAAVASRPRCKSTAGVGSFQALQAVKGTHTRVHASIPARARPRRD